MPKLKSIIEKRASRIKDTPGISRSLVKLKDINMFPSIMGKIRLNLSPGETFEYIPSIKDRLESPNQSDIYRSTTGSYPRGEVILDPTNRNTVAAKELPGAPYNINIDSSLTGSKGTLIYSKGKRPMSSILNRIAEVRKRFPEMTQLDLVSEQTPQQAISSPYYREQVRKFNNPAIYPDEGARPEPQQSRKTKTIKLKSPYVEE